MRIYIVTDLEGVNGVLNFDDWCVPEGRRNETACRFLTEEVNAAVDGFFTGGATEVIVFDGHGSGGSIRGELLDSRAALQRGCKDFPVSYEEVDAVAFVGQHAKAGTANAHLAHTQTEEAVDFRINGVSLGEFGQIAYTYNELNIPTIFACGDLALTREAAELIPNIYTVAVKEGFNTPQGKDRKAEDLFNFESTAVHYPRAKVLADIRLQCMLAAEKFKNDPDAFAAVPLPGTSYSITAEYRRTSPRLFDLVGDLPERKITTASHTSVAEAIREFYAQREWTKPDGKFITEL
ncbi:MAG: hypothetical protein E7039_09245 [Lentisphaerae bacterium]|nr:hypothetical protein [Lentisphaerota bacterium]